MTKTLKKRGGAVTGSFWDRFKSQQQLENDAKAEAVRWEASQLKHEQSEKDKLIQAQLDAAQEEAEELERRKELYGGKKSRKQNKTEKRRKTKRVKKSNK